MSTSTLATTTRDAPSLVVKRLLTEKEPELQAILPPHMTTTKVIQTCSMLVYDNEQLQKCDPFSIVKSVMEGCECGLSFSKASGEAYLVPFKTRKKGADGKWTEKFEASFIPGYRGIAKLLYQSGFVRRIHAGLVYEGEPFLWRETSTGLEFMHEPVADNRGLRVQRVYAIATFENGEREGRQWAAGDYAFAKLPTKSDGYTLDLNPEQVDQAGKLRLRSKAPNSPAWINDWAEMVMKGPVRNLAKMLPKSEKLIAALEADNRSYLEDQGPRALALAPGNHGSRSAALAASLRRSLPAANTTADAPETPHGPNVAADEPEYNTHELAPERDPGADDV